ncbi:8-amino-7-oxononanoate synthase [Marinagarivorans algicola]|uniref:8-amino-7-oxononanoate synthase n=1 Tax=Marinagarivorans algicola TaxID=1513270 RepID=UPI0006B50DFA|nr:8-amino-7-oxononanoate synthase [Marinagarivorans algicola]
MNFEQHLQSRLAQQKAANWYRQRNTIAHQTSLGQQLVDHTMPVVNFCSNDYLGLSVHPKVKAAAGQALHEFGVGSGASHLVSGHSHYHHTLEQALAQMTGRARALLLSTGYMANVGLITALAGKTQHILCDKLNHASIIDACQLAAAKNGVKQFIRYRHCDLAHLEQLLQKAPPHSLVVSDGVFSMDGNCAPLGSIAALCQKYHAVFVVDDAHGFGCLGDQGAGSVQAAGLTERDVPVYMGTLGKAVGGFGAFIAGSEALIETLIQFARPYIYTTALPPAVAAANLQSLQLIAHSKTLRAALNSNIAIFTTRIAAHCQHSAHWQQVTLLPSQTAIQPIILGCEKTTMSVAQSLMDAGFWVGAIRPPTVPKGTARLRITLSASHSASQIEALIAALDHALVQTMTPPASHNDE